MFRLIIVAFSLTLFFPFQSYAQPAPCKPYMEMRYGLETNFGEVIIFKGQLNDPSQPMGLEVYANTETGSFSAVVIRNSSSGLIGCLVATGRDGMTTNNQSGDKL